MSEFRRRVGFGVVEPVLEAENVAGRLLAFRYRIDACAAPDQTGQFQFPQMVVKRGSADLAIRRQPRLRRKAAEIGIVAVAEVPEHDLGRRLQPPLQDGPVRREMAHARVLRRGFRACTRVVIP